MNKTYRVLVALVFALATSAETFASAGTTVVEGAGVSFTRSEAYANDATILSDGSTVIAGRFSAAKGLPRGSIALLQPDGTVASNWVVTCDGQEWAEAFGECDIAQVELGSDGWVYFAGDFTRINGIARNGLARVRLTDASLDPQWDPIPPEGPRAASFTLFDGGIIVGAKKYSLLGTGAHLSEFNPPPNLGIIRSGDNLLMITGTFDLQGLARIDPITGATDPSWSAGIEVNRWLGWNSDSPYVVGRTAGSQDQPLGRLVLVDTTINPGLKPSWSLSPELALSSGDNHFGLDGLLHLVKSSDPGQPGARLVLVSVTLGDVAEVIREAILPPAPTCDGTVLGVDAVGSVYLSLAPCRSETAQWSPDGSNIGRMLPSGAIDPSWKSGIQNFGLIYDAERGPDGSIVVAGSFDRVNGIPRRGLARLTADLQLDEWNPQVEVSRFRAATIDSQGDVYAATGPRGLFEPSGFFKISGTTGIIDSTWNPSGIAGPNNAEISELLFDRENSSLYVSFRYAEFRICGGTRTGLAKVSASSPCRVDPAFRPNPSSPPRSLLLDGGKLYVTGEFDRIDGQPLASAVRFLANGQLDLNWSPFGSAPWPAPYVTGLTTTSRGVVMGGAFNAVRGTPRPGLALVSNGNGELDAAWSNLGAWGFNSAVGRLSDDVLVVRNDISSRGRLGTLSLVPVAQDGSPDPSWPALDIGAVPEEGFNIVFVALDENTTLVLGNFTRLGDSFTGNSAKLYRVAPTVFQDGFE